MIIANGTLEFGRMTGGGIDNNGYAKAGNVTWDSPIPCQYYANVKNNLGRSNGEAIVSAQYVILIEQTDVTTERIRLKSLSGAVIGEFSVISETQLDCVSETQILV